MDMSNNPSQETLIMARLHDVQAAQKTMIETMETNFASIRAQTMKTLNRQGQIERDLAVLKEVQNTDRQMDRIERERIADSVKVIEGRLSRIFSWLWRVAGTVVGAAILGFTGYFINFKGG